MKTLADKFNGDLTDLDQSLQCTLLEIEEKKKLNTDVNTERKLLKSRRLFRRLNESHESLIEPVHKEKDVDKRKAILPTAVQMGTEKNIENPLKRSRWKVDKDQQLITNSTPNSLANINSFDISLPKRKKLSNKSSIFDKSVSEPIVNHNLSPINVSRQTMPKPQSPLVTQKSTGQHLFFTPKTQRRNSLRTRLLKKSARKKYQNSSKCWDSDCSLLSDKDQSEILVPDTHQKDYPSPEKSSGPSVTILGTPICFSKITDTSITSSIFDFLDSPNMSRLMDKIIPNRSKSISYDHVLFQPKEVGDHYSRALPPNFKEKKEYISNQFFHPTVDDTNKMFNASSQSRKHSRVSILRKSVRKSPKMIGCTNDKPIHEEIFKKQIGAHKSNTSSTELSCSKSFQKPPMTDELEKNPPIDTEANISSVKIFQPDQIDHPSANIPDHQNIKKTPSYLEIIDQNSILNQIDKNPIIPMKRYNTRRSLAAIGKISHSTNSDITIPPKQSSAVEVTFPMGIFKEPKNNPIITDKQYNTRRSSSRLNEPAKKLTHLISSIKSTAENAKINLERPLSRFDGGKTINAARKNPPTKIFKKNRDSADDFVFNPLSIPNVKGHRLRK